MPQEVRIWEIGAKDRLSEIKRDRLNLEQRIQSWLEQDISLVSDDLLVIGREVATGFGGAIDLLCLDANGDTVIVELKRDKTPRDITAQILDYASWVVDLSAERITEIASEYLAKKGRGSFEEAFEEKFRNSPDTINGQHRMLIVASSLDSATERIVNYLSGTYGVDINAVQFQYFRGTDGREYVARVFLIDPGQVEYSTRTKGTSKRAPNLTPEQLRAIAEEKGVGELYDQLVESLADLFDSRKTTPNMVAFEKTLEGSRLTVFRLEPRSSSAEQGIHYWAYDGRLSEYLGVGRGSIVAILPAGAKTDPAGNWADGTLTGFFKEPVEIRTFREGLQQLQQKQA